MRRSLSRVALVLVLAAPSAAGQARTVGLRPGMVITKSTTITRKHYQLAAPLSLDSALITVRGDGITLDLNGATLTGTVRGDDPDQAGGVAIRVEGGSHVTIKNGTIHGYRVNIFVRGTRDLHLDDLDVGRSWKPRLYSLVEHESIVDWLSFHHNEKNEWLRYGAGVYLDGVTGGEIRRVTAEQGMNGLLLTRSDSLFIHDNTFSFNSGLGIGMYRSSHDRILHNRLDFNVRGYSNGFYWRGQDSADLLMFEQSSGNEVAYNSATHGGDGLFLWAGQSTMDSGEGGANDNRFSMNDFSYAPANAMEATFSRNSFKSNIASGSDYGLWGGYSYDSDISCNFFERDRTGVAIEHGQKNRISTNLFDSVGVAIRLWGEKVEPSEWGYPKHRDTDSRDETISGNRIGRARVALSIASTTGASASLNHYVTVDTLMQVAGALEPSFDPPFVRDSALTPLPCAFSGNESGKATTRALSPAVIRSGIPASPLSLRDRSAIIVDEWGPYDWRTPKLWPVDSTRARPLRLAVLGPAGKWTVAAQRGIAAISATAGTMNDTITVTPDAGTPTDWLLTLKSGDRLFRYGVFEPAQEWAERFFVWSDSTDPRTHPGRFDALLNGEPVRTMHAPRLDYEWYKPKDPGIPQERWALEATATVTLPSGEYTLRTISDDGVRVWVDGVRVIDDWAAHESAVAVAPLTGGTHTVHVVYYQVDGWTELRVDIIRGDQRAGGSPGPH